MIERNDLPLDILVVDDKPEVGGVNQALLTAIGNKVDLVSPVEVIAAFKKKEYDCVYTDRDMPGITGEDLAARLKEEATFAGRNKVPAIVLITGNYFNDKEQSQMRAKGVDVFLQKPATLSTLRQSLASVRTILSSQKKP